TGGWRNPKFEIRNPKQIPNPNKKIPNSGALLFRIFFLNDSSLFRISDFDIRILPVLRSLTLPARRRVSAGRQKDSVLALVFDLCLAKEDPNSRHREQGF